MTVFKFKDSHYEIIKEWWPQYGWTPPGLDVLPKTGFLVLDNNQCPVVAAFYYRSCSGMAYMDWVIGDKNASAMSRGKGVYKAVKAVIEHARKEGFKVLYTVTANQPLIETYKKIGLQEMETGATTLAMSLDGANTNFLR